ncbi:MULTISPECIES: guanine deaminase [unclassified Lentimicrobium]|uniref:guanine deaminase n=1 Tax=unclassified Lentimicrobium TaxID=2677434 RepID=UPI001552677C|nr:MULTISPECIES: guanine deaminase [unclassified Lentimicrobium]NPD44447.1 guanine deaminase [Lentimicrobium sp. S6]NPD83365.1 guanine deaminase [Lentimicrobium sp. L6]
MKTNQIKGIRAQIFHFISKDQYEFFEDGLLIMDHGLVKALGSYKDLKSQWSSQVVIEHYRDRILMPGFIDAHIHGVQTAVMASYGADLLQWLKEYTFPLENQFSDADFAKKATHFFFRQMLKNGTTTAAIYSSVHQESIVAIMEEALRLNMRIQAGKTNMDRNAPANLCEATNETFKIGEELIQKYEGKGRLNYLLTPRFAITSTPEQLQQLQLLKEKYPHIGVQTHISENHEEIESTKNLFPDRKDYLDVYEHYDLVEKNTLLGHAIHFSVDEWKRVKESNASLVHCPTSNLFLGSGLFNLQKAWEEDIPLALASDVGGGMSFSMLKTAAAAYQVAALRGYKATALQLFYLLTLGGARAMGLDDKIGNFEIGKEADFILLDSSNIELVDERLKTAKTLEEKLFAILILGDDRLMDSVWLMGESVEF